MNLQYRVSYISDPGIGEFHAMPTNHLNVCKHSFYSVSYISDPGIEEFHAMPTNHLNVCKHSFYSVSYISDPGIGEFHAMPTNHLNVCKPTNRDSELYKLTLNFINKCLFQQYANVVSLGEFLLRNNK